MSVVAFMWIGVAAVCCGLCIYGIDRAIHRSRKRESEDHPVTTHR